MNIIKGVPIKSSAKKQARARNLKIRNQSETRDYDAIMAAINASFSRAVMYGRVRTSLILFSRSLLRRAAASTLGINSDSSHGFIKKSSEPMRMASTAAVTVAWSVSMIGSSSGYMAFNAAECFHAVHAWHLDIQQHHINVFSLIQKTQGIFATHDKVHLITPAHQPPGKGLNKTLFVID